MGGLRELLGDAIGEEIQPKDVNVAGKIKVIHFRQLSGEEGQAVFRNKADGEGAEAYGLDVSRRLVAASACTPDGTPLDTYEGVCRLPGFVVTALYRAAAEVNGIRVAAEGEGPKDPGSKSESGAP